MGARASSSISKHIVYNKVGKEDTKGGDEVESR